LGQNFAAWASAPQFAHMAALGCTMGVPHYPPGCPQSGACRATIHLNWNSESLAGVFILKSNRESSDYGGKMKIPKTFHLFILASLLVACAAPGTKTPVTPKPAIPTDTALLSATATPMPIPTMPQATATKPIPKSIDPGSSVIQVDYPSYSGLSNASLSLVDPETGQILPEKGSFPGRMDAITAVSGRLAAGRLAAVQGTDQVCEPMAYGTSCYNQADVLHLVDLTSLQEVTTTLPAQGWVNLAAFSPDGTRLALADNQKQTSTLMYIDVDKGSILASQPLSIRPSLIAFRPSDDQLVVYGQPLGPNPGEQQPGNPHLLVLDLPDLKIAWDRELTGILSGFWCETNCDSSFEQRSFANWYPAVVAAPDGSALYIAHPDQEVLTYVDLHARTVTVTRLQIASSWLEQLLSLSTQVAYAKGNQNGTNLQGVLSPDGRRLYLLGQSFQSTKEANGNWNTDITYSGLKVIDIKTGRILKHLETHASELQISTDGDYLYMMNWDSPQAETEVVSTDKLQIVKKLPGWEVTLTRQLNGTPIAMATQVEYTTQEEVGVLDPQSFSIGQIWKSSADIQFVPIQ
jgi:WD40 repeat protein